MIPYQFNYKRAASVAEAEEMLRTSPDGKLLAGGQTLIAAMKMRLANPSIHVYGVAGAQIATHVNDLVVSA